MITVAEQTFNEVYGDSFKPNQARNIARIVCTPFFREIDDNTSEAMFFKALFQPMCDMSFGIFVDEKARFVTSDKTIYAHALSFPCDEYEKLIFPITSQLCLVMFGGEEKKACPKKNFLCPIDDEALASIFCAIVDASYKKIFSGHCLDAKEIKMINRIRDGVIDNEL